MALLSISSTNLTEINTDYPKVDVDDIIEAADLFMDSKKSAAMFKENDPNSKFIV